MIPLAKPLPADEPGLAVRPDPAHIGRMAKTKSPRVTFKMHRVAQDDWQIEAHCPGVEVRHIKGFKTRPRSTSG